VGFTTAACAKSMGYLVSYIVRWAAFEAAGTGHAAAAAAAASARLLAAVRVACGDGQHPHPDGGRPPSGKSAPQDVLNRSPASYCLFFALRSPKSLKNAEASLTEA
jgi:hypothetical protein